jgi:hypothetical protein
LVERVGSLMKIQCRIMRGRQTVWEGIWSVFGRVQRDFPLPSQVVVKRYGQKFVFEFIETTGPSRHSWLDRIPTWLIKEGDLIHFRKAK